MADINKFQRSKESIAEVLRHLMHVDVKDEGTDLYIIDLQRSIQILDHKMEALVRLNGCE
jgi:hypothetical protein